MLSACGEAEQRPESTKLLDVVDDPRAVGRIIKQVSVSSTYADEAACVGAGHSWTDFYQVGDILTRNVPDGGFGFPVKSCWVKPSPFSDGGKRCQGQSDCEGNCLAAIVFDGDAKRAAGGFCQSDAQNSCFSYIFESGQAYFYSCPPA